MIKFVYPIKENVLNKNVYVYGANRSSSDVFIRLVMMNIHVHGFVTHKTCVGEVYCRVPIIDCNMVKSDDKHIVIYDEWVKPSIIQEMTDKGLCIESFNNIFTKVPNDELKNKRCFIYGAGKSAEDLSKILCDNCIYPTKFLISATKGRKKSFNLDVEEYREGLMKESDALIIPGMREEFIGQIAKKISSEKCDIYLEKLWKYENICASSLPQIIDFAFKHTKKFYYVSDSNILSNYFKNALESIGITFDGWYSDNNETDEKNIKDIFELSNVDSDNGIVILWELDNIRRISYIQKLFVLGFNLEKYNLTSIQKYTETDKVLSRENYYVADGLLSGSMRYGKEQTTGWKILGDPIKCKKKLVVLGGSTSTDEYYRPESWVKKLFKLLDGEVCIIIGANCGDNCASEYLRFVRDAHIINPDFVISMSGANNRYIRGINYFNDDYTVRMAEKEGTLVDMYTGLYNGEGVYQSWKRVEMLIKKYSDFLGAKFFAVLQPMNSYMEKMTAEDLFFFEEETLTSGSKEFYEESKNDFDIISLIDLFHDTNGNYIDSFHYSDKGNEKLAKSVFDILSIYIQT